MDEADQGIATAALTLQSCLLQALVYKGILSRDDALDIVDRSQKAARSAPSAVEAGVVAEITQGCLEGVREGLTEMPFRQ